MYQIFLADDEPWVLMSLKNLIDWGEEGFAVCGEATDGEKAWERILRTKPDLVVTDIRMPGNDGLELMKKMREAGLETEVLVVSGYSDFEYARQGMRYGCRGYILKPVDEDELLEALRGVKKALDEKTVPADGKENQQEEPGYLSESQTVKKLLQHMEEHYREVTLQQLAEAFSMSTGAVSQLIRRKTGKPYSEHLLGFRMQQAQKLLRETNESLESIAEQVGYGDYFYFLKVFKKATGISPSAYRKNL